MSEVAGKLAIQAGATHLQKNHGGRGVLLGGVTGVPKAKVVIIGGGTVGTNAAKVAVGMGARTVVMDSYAPRLTYLDDVFGGSIETVLSTEAAIEEEITDADIVVGGVLLPGGAQAPHLVKKAAQGDAAGLGPRRRGHRPGRLLRDLRADTHTDPTYVVDGVIHYCVANMPGAVARTSTMALAGATLPFGLASPTRASRRPSRRTRPSPWASTSTVASSPSRRWPRPTS